MKIDRKVLAEISAREKRMTAIHEAGHLVILQRFGGIGQAFVWPNTSGRMDEKAWRGTCTMFAAPDKIDYSKVPVKYRPKTSKKWLMFYALAGLAAERIVEDREEAADALFNYLFDGEDISESDRRDIGEHVSYHDCKRMVAMLVEEWPRVLEKAERLMEFPEECPYLQQ